MFFQMQFVWILLFLFCDFFFNCQLFFVVFVISDSRIIKYILFVLSIHFVISTSASVFHQNCIPRLQHTVLPPRIYESLTDSTAYTYWIIFWSLGWIKWIIKRNHRLVFWSVLVSVSANGFQALDLRQSDIRWHPGTNDV